MRGKARRTVTYLWLITFLIFIAVEDSERHDGSPEKPYYMNKSLKKILGKKNKKPSDEEDWNFDFLKQSSGMTEKTV